ncbi:hypothetical protein [Jannaschia seohaensis]|uniref:DUF4239 domain-containing protein n=1 Tax=Jannaschia seohaensis TaxID=475081 RepID=A0A2Y9AMG4_9RHOB|nr:hypothetical protein [Jannaschia seohaensis]PWJ20453.1 hypothetical protein BCF38_103271 [Jannaschia seohaensis]SSA44548.1 hypothetical protein SAMN05421539_103271 [Jannaschia seohaensis]
MTGSILAAPAFVLLIVGISMAAYGLTRRLLRGHMDEDTRDLAGSVLFRIASLHGLVLALVFAQDLANLRDVSVSAAHEATLVADIYYDAGRYAGPESAAIQHAMAHYGLLVAEEEWPRLAEQRRLLPEAWGTWERAYHLLLDATPATARQERLHGIMLTDIRLLSELRDTRGNVAQAGVSTVFVFAALIGVILVSAAYFPWAPTRLNLGLIAGFSAFTGVVLYIIIAFSNPFASPGRAPTVGFERFLTPEVRAMAAQPVPAQAQEAPAD